MLIIAGSVYFFWWFAVEALLPNSFNPFYSRMTVVSYIFGVLGLSYVKPWVQEKLRILFYIGVWGMTLHYFYLVYGNNGGMDWIIGSFITVAAINFCFLTIRSLFLYSIFVLILVLILDYLIPTLRYSVFFPGIFTILFQGNFALRSRLNLIKTLADSNERFSLLFNSTFEGVLVHETGKVTDVNDSLCRLTGYSRFEILQNDVLMVVHPEDHPFVLQKIQTGDERAYQTRCLKKNGQIVDIEIRARNFQAGNHIARLVTVQDLTDRKNAEKERVEKLTMEENVRLRDEFISIASHELKTPITSLKLQTQMIERDLKKNPQITYTSEKLAEFVGLFNRQVGRLTELIETMLDVSRISSGRLVLDLQNINFPIVVKEVVEAIQQGTATRPSISVEAPEHLVIWGDRSRLKQVVENLLTNAIKYGEEKPIKIKLREEKNQILLQVEDHGLGIAADLQSKIFDRFERAISSRHISGLGLGLYITRQIVEAHEGTIRVESTLGSGSLFTVALPTYSHVRDFGKKSQES